MKVAKAHAYTTPGSIAPLVTPDECAKLFTLPALAFKLFVCLVHVVDFKTGRGVTGYPELVAMLTPAQPERGRPLPVPTRDEVKHMLRRFIDLGLIARDKGGSEDAKRIIFAMPTRSWESVSAELAARLTARRANPQNPDEHRAKRRMGRIYRPTSRPRIQEDISFIKESKTPELSTGDESEHHAPPQGEKMTPPRGLNDAPAGPTPPPEALRDTGAGHGEGSHQGPPGGQSDAPTGHAPRELAPGPWVRGQDTGAQYSDPSTWERDPQGRLIPPEGHGTRTRAPRRFGREAGLRKAFES